jgi:hypothetical protein
VVACKISGLGFGTLCSILRISVFGGQTVLLGFTLRYLGAECECRGWCRANDMPD